MPFTSEAQRRYLWANEPEVARDWAHEYPGQKNLPYKKKKPSEKKGIDSMSTIAGLAKMAADTILVEKLAADTQVSPDLVRHLATTVKMDPTEFCKAAYADPKGYTDFLKVATALMTKKAIGMVGPGMVASFAGNKLIQKLGDAFKYLGANSPSGKTVGKAGLIGGGVGLGGYGGYKALNVGKGDVKPDGQQGPNEQVVNSMAGQNAAQAPPAAPQPQQPGAQPQKPGMGTPLKALMAAGGVGLGALGAGAIMRRKKKSQMGQSKIASAQEVLCDLIVRRSAALYRKEAADAFCRYLDTIARHMTLEKTAAVRTIQKEVASGNSLANAIKLAYPHLTGEQRGLLAGKLVTAAATYKKANAGCAPMGVQAPQPLAMPTQQPQAWSGPIGDAAGQMNKMAGEACSAGMPKVRRKQEFTGKPSKAKGAMKAMV